MKRDSGYSAPSVPRRGNRRLPGWVWRAPVLLVLMLAFMITTAAHPGSVNSQPQTPGRATLVTRAEGVLQMTSPGRWRVGRLDVLVDDATVLVEERGKVEPGAWVVVSGPQSEGGKIDAAIIQVDQPASLATPNVQLSGMLLKKTTAWWLVEQTVVTITPDTAINGDPDVGALVWVVAAQQGNALIALSTEILAPNSEVALSAFEFEGTITALMDLSWRVDEREVLIDLNTEILGDRQIGKIAEVQAVGLPDGRLLARRIRVVERASEANLNAMVEAISADTPGTERWEVVVFPKSAWADPTLATLHVGPNTYVDESRATAQTGVWAEMRGAPLGVEEYQADVIHVERPIPVSITGEIQPPPTTQSASGWGQINGQPVWLGAVDQGLNSTQAVFGSNVSVTGVRLGNGVIWAQQVRSVAP